jgi:PAS domain S-box-containing protein
MSVQIPLYNSRLTKIYMQYLGKYYPNLSTSDVLEESGIANYEVEDPAHWFTQEQVDRFHDVIIQKTGNPNISREVGRFAAYSEGMGAAKQYILGLMSPGSLYLLMEKHYPVLSRGVSISARKIGQNTVELVAVPKPGVVEKPYQCENRTGLFEALAKLLTEKFARIEHPDCFHRGQDRCRYLITWEKTPPLIWRRIRNIFLGIGSLAAIVLFFVLPIDQWLLFLLLAALVSITLSFNSVRLERNLYSKTVETQKEAAEESLVESEVRYNNAMLIQEIGQATSRILDIERLAKTVVGIMEKRLDFDRGMIMLADRPRAFLSYSAGYGHTPEIEALLKKTEFHLNNPESMGVFVKAMREQQPFLVNDISEIESMLSPRSLEYARRLGTQSMICVPIVYERESLGILAVDNSKSKRQLRQSDMSLLMGVASQLAVSIINALAFEKTRASEKQYRELVETANSLILRMGIDGEISFCNRFAQRFFGYTQSEIMQQNAARMVLPQINGMADNRRRFERLVSDLESDPKRPIVTEGEFVLRSGERVWIAWTYKPIFDDDGNYVEILCIGNDISKLRRADRERKELQAQLQRAQKMEAIGTLAGGVAHDLNNILSGIVSYPELLLMDLEPQSPLRKPILTIQQSGEKAAAIVQDLLTLARRGVETTDVVNLNDILTDYLQSPEHAKLEMNHPEVSVVTRMGEDLLNILGSPVHLSKTIMNLVSNAAEAMLDGGRLLIATENRNVDRLTVAYDEIVEGDYVTLSVKDSGIGIAEDDIERIFEPFYTKKKMGRSGTGLGMAVVWGTVKDHRGYIDVRSSEGVGTEITLYFPVTRKRFKLTDEFSSRHIHQGQGETVMVVDDIAEQRDIASEMLIRLGYRVITMDSGEAALAYFKNGSVDLLVLDMIMDPGIDGLETFRQVLALHPGQKTIIASGFSESSRVKEALKLGAAAYIKKPYLLEHFGRAVRMALDRNPGDRSSS